MLKMLWTGLTTALVLAAGSAIGTAQASVIHVGNWTPIFQGIDATTATIDGSVAYAVRIDLNAPGISFTTTPAGGPLNTIAQTTSQFLESSHTQVAINADFFDPCCNAAAEPKHLEGLAISNGNLVAPDTSPAFADLLLTKANQATITSSPGSLAGVYNAVSGSNILVAAGVNVAPTADTSFNDANPRSVVGISQNGEDLYLVAIDGRQPGYSAGTSLVETADLMLALGAYNALNLDGGGSTALVESNGHGGAFDLNRPSGGTERYDGNNLGVFANPLPTPEPSTLALLAVGAACVMAAARRRS